MAGTPEQMRRIAPLGGQATVAKFQSEEERHEYYRRLGQKGGMAPRKNKRAKEGQEG